MQRTRFETTVAHFLHMLKTVQEESRRQFRRKEVPVSGAAERLRRPLDLTLDSIVSLIAGEWHLF